MTAGYSGTPLARKLGIGPDAVVGTFGAPAGFEALLEPLPVGAGVVASPTASCDVVVAFAVTNDELEGRFAAALGVLPAAGGLWVAWPKRASGVATDHLFETIQRHGLDHGLVDNKVCAIDETWSALRFVVRSADRKAWGR